MLGWLLTGAALGCGGMFGPVDGDVFSDAQQVLFEQQGTAVSVEYLVDYGGDQSDFGWIVPIPGAFLDLQEGDPDRFETLRRQTSVPVDFVAEDAGGGCGPRAKNDLAGGGRSTEGLEIVAEGRAGVFAYQVVQSDSVVPITTWLEDRGWDVGPSFPSIEAYVIEGGWQFVAIELAEEVPPEDLEGSGQSVARIVYEGPSMRFPARMSRYSTAVEQKTTIYVQGDQRATMQGWEVVDYQGGQFVGDWDYDTGLRLVLEGQPRYAVVFADEIDGQWVTRFDTIADSDVHDDDPQLLLDGGIVTHLPTVTVYESVEAHEDAQRDGGCAVAPTRAAAGWVLLAAIAVRRRR